MATDRRGDYDARTTEAILEETATIIREFGLAGGHVILIGGLVPGLLVPILDPGVEAHVGSRDVDMCLSAALIGDEVGEYERLERSLRDAGYDMARRSDGQPESWRWTGGRRQRITIEFFCLATPDVPAGRLFRPGGIVGRRLCALALDAGLTGLAAFIATKVDAIAGRSKNKDSYDLVWLLNAWQGGPTGAAQTVRDSAIWDRSELQSALDRVERQFATLDDAGPRQYARFVDRQDADREARHASDTVKAFGQRLRELGREG